jgi:hypothetical protein
MKGEAMKLHRRRILAAVAAVAAVVAAAVLVLPAQATPPVKVTTSTIGIGRFTEIDATVKTDINPGPATKFWRARIKTRGPQISMSCRTRSPQGGPSAGTATPAPAW